MIYLEYELAQGSKILFELHEAHLSPGLSVDSFDGDKAVKSDVSLKDALEPVLRFSEEIFQRTGKSNLDAEVSLGVTFTSRGHAIVVPGSHALFTLKIKSR